MIDIIIYVVIGIAIFIGYSMGVIRQIGSIAAIISAFVICYLFGDVASQWAASCMGFNTAETLSLEQYWSASLIGHITLFVIVWLAVGLASRLMKKVVKAVKLGPIDGAFGAAFMTFKIMIAISVILNLWSYIDPNSDLIKSGGPITRFTIEFGPKLLGVVSETL